MSIRGSLPAIDFKNDWLNKDRELYTLIFTKTCVGVALNAVNIVLGDETFEDASGRSLGVVFSGVLEMANVSGSRFFLELNTAGNSSTRPSGGADTAILVIYDISFGGLLSIVDYALNSRFVHIPIPAIPPVAQIDNYIVNPLHAGMVRIFLPPEQVIGRPNTIPAQRILGGLSVLNNVIGSLAVSAGIIATQAVRG